MALHVEKQPTEIESTVQYFIPFLHFFVTVQNLILAWEGTHKWLQQHFPQDKSLSHDMKVAEKAPISQRCIKTNHLSLISSWGALLTTEVLLHIFSVWRTNCHAMYKLPLSLADTHKENHHWLGEAHY